MRVKSPPSDPVKHIASVVFLSIALLSTTTMAADSRPIATIKSYFQRRAANDGFSGIVLIARGRKILLQKSFGEADREHRIPFQPIDPVRIGSLTKPVTAIAVMRTIEAGKLRLDDPICKYLSKCPQGWEAVTIDQLMTHSSGLPDLFEKLPAVPVEQTTAEIDKVLAGPDTKPVEAAGTLYRYNNFGYILLGYTLEKVYAKTYPEIMEQEVFGPAGMNQATYDYPDRIIANRVRGYVRHGMTLVNTTGDPAAYSAGGLLLSSQDFLNFEWALFHGSLLKPDTRALLFAPPKGQNYGRGWQVAEIFGRIAYQHNGETDGASASFAYIPADDLWIHVLSNIEDTPTRAYLCDALGQFEHADYPDPTLAPRNLAAESRFAGVYVYADGTSRAFALKDGVLTYVNGTKEYPLRPLAPGRYALIADEQTRLDFRTSTTGVTVTRSRCGGEFATATRSGP
jgi:CubicO group peptidase (beta-lactamase class C family)